MVDQSSSAGNGSRWRRWLRRAADYMGEAIGGPHRPPAPDPSPVNVAEVVEHFLAGTDAPTEFDDFTLGPYQTPELERFRVWWCELPDQYPPGRGGGCCGEDGLVLLRQALIDL